MKQPTLEVKQNTKDLVLAAYPHAVAKLIQNGAQIIDSSNEDVLATVLVESMHLQDPVAFAWREVLKMMQCPETPSVHMRQR